MPCLLAKDLSCTFGCLAHLVAIPLGSITIRSAKFCNSRHRCTWQKNNITMKLNADKEVSQTPSIEHVVVVKRTGEYVKMDSMRDIWWHEAVSGVDSKCEPEVMDAEDPLFSLSSGSTGKPKGVLHTTGGYLVYTIYF